MQMREALEDLRLTVDDLVAGDNKVFLRATLDGTHAGMFLGVPGTGKRVSIPVAGQFRFEAGKIVEHWGVMETAALRSSRK